MKSSEKKSVDKVRSPEQSPSWGSSPNTETGRRSYSHHTLYSYHPSGSSSSTAPQNPLGRPGSPLQSPHIVRQRLDDTDDFAVVDPGSLGPEIFGLPSEPMPLSTDVLRPGAPSALSFWLQGWANDGPGLESAKEAVAQIPDDNAPLVKHYGGLLWEHLRLCPTLSHFSFEQGEELVEFAGKFESSGCPQLLMTRNGQSDDFESDPTRSATILLRRDNTAAAWQSVDAQGVTKTIDNLSDWLERQLEHADHDGLRLLHLLPRSNDEWIELLKPVNSRFSNVGKAFAQHLADTGVNLQRSQDAGGAVIGPGDEEIENLLMSMVRRKAIKPELWAQRINVHVLEAREHRARLREEEKVLIDSFRELRAEVDAFNPENKKEKKRRKELSCQLDDLASQLTEKRQEIRTGRHESLDALVQRIAGRKPGGPVQRLKGLDFNEVAMMLSPEQADLEIKDMSGNQQWQGNTVPISERLCRALLAHVRAKSFNPKGCNLALNQEARFNMNQGLLAKYFQSVKRRPTGTANPLKSSLMSNIRSGALVAISHIEKRVPVLSANPLDCDDASWVIEKAAEQLSNSGRSRTFAHWARSHFDADRARFISWAGPLEALEWGAEQAPIRKRGATGLTPEHKKADDHAHDFFSNYRISNPGSNLTDSALSQFYAAYYSGLRELQSKKVTEEQLNDVDVVPDVDLPIVLKAFGLKIGSDAHQNRHALLEKARELGGLQLCHSLLLSVPPSLSSNILAGMDTAQFATALKMVHGVELRRRLGKFSPALASDFELLKALETTSLDTAPKRLVRTAVYELQQRYNPEAPRTIRDLSNAEELLALSRWKPGQKALYRANIALQWVKSQAEEAPPLLLKQNNDWVSSFQAKDPEAAATAQSWMKAVETSYLKHLTENPVLAAFATDDAVQFVADALELLHSQQAAPLPPEAFVRSHLSKLYEWWKARAGEATTVDAVQDEGEMEIDFDEFLILDNHPDLI